MAGALRAQRNYFSLKNCDMAYHYGLFTLLYLPVMGILNNKNTKKKNGMTRKKYGGNEIPISLSALVRGYPVIINQRLPCFLRLGHLINRKGRV